MKRPLLIITGTLALVIIVSAAWYLSKLNFSKYGHIAASAKAAAKISLRLKDKTGPILSFAKNNGYNTKTCFVADMSMGSGKNRFFIYNPAKDSVLDAGLVTHGRCNKSWLTGRKYGNTVGCGCTSLGKYKIGKPYKGKFGLAYKLHGLDSTNSNAFKRFVVLHSHDCVPEDEVDPYPICQSDGCPTVSPGFLKKLAAVIDASQQPVLLWVVE